jgi:SAM-dependent methyltransferase
MTRIPFADGSVNHCLSINSLYPLVPRESSNADAPLHLAISEVRRVLEPNGLFVASVPDPNFAEYTSLLGSITEHFRYLIRDSGIKGVVRDLLNIFRNVKRASQVLDIQMKLTQMYRLPTDEEYIAILEENGFKIEETRDVPTGNTLIVARKA